jgi:AraC-like DNA-binding protein
VNRGLPERPFTMFRCAQAGVQAVGAATRHSFARHWHEQYGVGIIDRGAHRSASGRGMVEAHAGDAITVNPGEIHDGAPIGDSGRAWRMLYFEPAFILDAIDDMHERGSRVQEFPLPVINDARVAAIFARLFQAMTDGNDKSSEIRREQLLLELLGRLLSGSARATPARMAPAAIARATDRIDAAPAAPVTLVALARECGLSRFQVLRGFVRATGFTPHAYLMQRRIDLARRLIARGAPLAEAADESGFADQSHMTRSFVSKFGVSPGAYAAAVC